MAKKKQCRFGKLKHPRGRRVCRKARRGSAKRAGSKRKKSAVKRRWFEVR